VCKAFCRELIVCAVVDVFSAVFAIPSNDGQQWLKLACSVFYILILILLHSFVYRIQSPQAVDMAEGRDITERKWSLIAA
jgi:hypothetical protein